MPGPLSGFPEDTPAVLPRPFEITPGGGGFPAEDAPDPLRQTFGQATQTKPDTAARVFNLRLKTGLPAGVIERNLDDVERQAAATDFNPERFRQANPHLTKWMLADPTHAAIAQDDLPALNGIERTLQVGLNSVRATVAGIGPKFNVGAFGLAQFGSEALGLSSWGDYFKRARAEASRIEEVWKGPQTGAGELEKAFYSGFESIGMTAAGLGMSVASGSPTPMLAMIGAQTGGEAYGQARDVGRGVVESSVFGLSQAAVEIATEKIPASLLLGDLAKRTGFFKTLLKQGVAEIPGEQVATVLQDLNEWATLNPDQPFSAYLAARPSAAAQTLVATLTMVGAQTSLATALDRVTGSSASQRVVEDLHAAVEGSKTRERAPEALSAFIQQATADGLTHVYAPAETFAEYFQTKGEDPAAIAAELTGDPAAYQLALATGGDLAIPTATYLARMVGSGHEAFFAKELRLDPNQLNGRETQERLQAQAAEQAPEAASDQQAEASAQIKAELVTRLVEGGQVDPQTAEIVASVIAEGFPNLAARGGVDLATLVQQWLPEVQAGGTPAAEPATFSQEPATPTPTAEQPLDPKFVAERQSVLDLMHPSAQAMQDRMFKEANPIFRARQAQILADGTSTRRGRIITFDQRSAQPAHGPANAAGVSAQFLGWQEGFEDIPAMALYNVSGGVLDRSTVTAAELAKEGIPLPETPELQVDEFGQSFFQGSGDRRASITFRQDAAPLIRLFTAKNRSSFLHEAGHLFLRMHGTIADQLAGLDQATLTPQQARLLADYRDVVLPHLGVTSTSEVGTPQQEQWAREWEAYLMEGKAPSVALRAVFFRVQTWLLGIYKSLQGLSREAGSPIVLNPEIRAVMDRLLASDEAIADAEQSAGVSALFITAADAQVPEPEFDGYRALVQTASDARRETLQARMMKDIAREDTDWWKAERANVREEVAAEVHQQPVYIALAAIQRGTKPDGAPIGDDASGVTIPLKLDKAAILQANPGAGMTGLRGLYVTEGGLPPDLVAPMVGFGSDAGAGEAMITALRTAPPMETVIDAAADQRMRERHGDLLLDPAALAAEAQQAIAEDHRDTVIRAELAMLRKLQAATAPVKQAAKAATLAGARRLRTELPNAATLKAGAEQQIRSMRLRDVRPDRFFASAKRASRLATEAAAKQDVDAAIMAKQDELVNLALYREALAMRVIVDGTPAEFEPMFKPDKVLAARRTMAYVHAGRTIAATYFWPERRLESAREALALIKTHDTDLHALLEARISPVLAMGADLQGLTGEAFLDMRETVASLWDTALRTRQHLVKGERIDHDLIVTEVLARMDDVAPAQPTRTPFAAGLLGFRANMTRLEHWITYMDGGNPDGVFRRYLHTPIADAKGRYQLAKLDVITQFHALLEPIRSTLVKGRIVAPELGGYTFASKAALLHAIAHTGNESNFQKLLRGYGWEGSITPVAGVEVDGSRWRAFMDRMFRDGIVTKADMDVVQGIWTLNESLKPAAQAAHLEMYGHYFNEITARPVVTPFGTYAGGYVPAILDPLESADGSARVNLDAIEGVHPTMFPPAGFTKSRVEPYAEALALDLALMPNHLDKVLRFVHLLPPAKEVQRLIQDRRVRDRLHAYNPALIGNLLQPWLQRFYSQKVADSSKTSGGQFLDRIARGIRSRVGLNTMAGHVVNVLQNMTGLFPAMAKVKPRYLRNALWRFTRDHKGMTAEIEAASPFMRMSGTGQVAEVLHSIDDILLNPNKYQTVVEFGKAHGYVLQQITQNVVSRVVWAGAYEQAVERGATHEDAARDGDSAVRETQSSGAAEDLSNIETGAPFLRLFTMFYGWANTMANLQASQWSIMARDMGLRQGAGRAFFLYTFTFLPIAALGEVIRQSLSGWDDDDDDTHVDEVMWLFFSSQQRLFTSFIPGGQVAQSGVNLAFTKTTFDDRISASPAIAVLEATGRAMFSGDLYTAMMEDGPKRQAVRDVLDAIGLLTGIPVGAIKRPAGYLVDVLDEREEPEDAMQLARGLVSGRSQAAP